MKIIIKAVKNVRVFAKIVSIHQIIVHNVMILILEIIVNSVTAFKVIFRIV